MNKYYIVVILRLYEVVSGHFCLSKWAGPTSENTFYSTKNLSLSDRTGFKKIKNCFFEQLRGQTTTHLVNFEKKKFYVVIAT